MAQAAKKKQKSGKNERDNESEDGPSLSDRTQAGMRIAGHLKKAAEGGSIRKGFSLWRVAKELPTAASGAGELFKRHPVPIALLGGVLTTAGVLVLAQGMGAFDANEQSGEERDEGEGDAGPEAEGDERE